VVPSDRILFLTNLEVNEMKKKLAENRTY